MGQKTWDQMAESLTRGVARRTSRRSLFTRLGAAMVAAPFIPLLPVARAEAEEPKSPFELDAQSSDPTKCNYWRHCAIDGVLCSCCGGGPHTCPPGSSPSPTAWVGTCLNPDDGRSYLISYRDCCGKGSCNAPRDCHCKTMDRELPVYRPQANNDIVWCFGASTMTYHCSTATLVSLAG